MCVLTRRSPLRCEWRRRMTEAWGQTAPPRSPGTERPGLQWSAEAVEGRGKRVNDTYYMHIHAQVM